MSQSTIESWVASATSKTTLASINTGKASAIILAISSISSVAATETNLSNLSNLQLTMRGALASLTIVSGEQYLATATATQDFPAVTNAILEATLNLQDIFDLNNGYHANVISAPNAIFAALFAILAFTQIGLFGWSRSWYFGVCMICGTGMECAGYIARALSAGGHETNSNYFTTQIVCLTIAPAFLMAALYFMLAQMMIVTGPKSSVMNPMSFSYIFIACDVISLLVQAGGGGTTSGTNPKLGTNIMLGGIAFQVVSMSAFIYFLVDFYIRSFFYYPLSAPHTVKSFFQILFATKKGIEYKDELESSYDPEFSDQRNWNRRLFLNLPLAMTAGVILIYVRCVYRVAELAGGLDGQLYRKEVFLMFLDALMIFAVCVLFLVFHVARIFGKTGVMSAKMLRRHAKDLKEKKAGSDNNLTDVDIEK